MGATDARCQGRSGVAPILCLVFASYGWSGGTSAAGPTVVINEVHYHPPFGSSGEFVELLNHGGDPVDLEGWVLDGGVEFAFGDTVIIAPGAFLLIAKDAGELIRRHGLEPGLVAGEYDGRLSNGGEELRLLNARALLVSAIDYSDDAPWPELPDGLGPSLERVSPLRQSSDPWAWVASIPIGGTPGERNSVAVDDRALDREIVELVPGGADWRFFRGLEEPPPAWTQVDFDDSDWEIGPAGFGYGDDDDRTVLEDMRNRYVTVYIRKTFEVEDSTRMIDVELLVDYDDGFVAYLNGVEIARRNVGDTGFDQPTTDRHEAGVAEPFPVVDGVELLSEGTNVLAIGGHNRALDSSDFTLAPELRALLAPEELPPPPRVWERPEPALVVNEVSRGGRGTGWVEMYNSTAAPVSAGGLSIRLEPPERGAYSLPPELVVLPASRVVVSERELGFELDDSPCLLTTGDGRYVDALAPREPGVDQSTGRFPDGGNEEHVFAVGTPGEPNRARPESPVVINEIMYRPASPPAGEYVELLNRSDAAVRLADWSFTRGIDYDFPRGAVLEAGGYLVVARDPRAVETRYGITGVLGPFDGRLDNDAETLLLRDDLGNVADRVRYADEGSWPEDPDGTGPSLELVHPGLENRYGPAWAASEGDGTPGAVNSRRTGDPSPIVVGVSHVPVVPSSTDTVRVLATASDEQPLARVALFVEVDGRGDGPAQVSMVDDGLGDDGVAGNGVHGAAITPRANRDVVAFWIEARDVGGGA